MQLIGYSGVRTEIEAGHVLFRPGDVCANAPVLLDGCVRAQRVTRYGREIVLYRVGPGGDVRAAERRPALRGIYAAEASVERSGNAVLLPAFKFDALLDRSYLFRRYVFDGFAGRIAALMDRMEDALDAPLEARLAALLVRRSVQARQFAVTHKELAVELASSRKVVTRVLPCNGPSGPMPRRLPCRRVNRPGALGVSVKWSDEEPDGYRPPFG